ncbi:hypothetical protein SAMD00019534_009670 [Acytostelium subglobosum LB1]|uniref:hypothetical protein n=1 Tax=Acytostelium subglobosum LB1 TaxID=1410327 RepID=UPI0006450D45|nr:hypothetical protein SAMD00019534_009670 [Acytostelium subglobosum LB1]GAM17792.1 hypothetical protein SAMD00019534_009670 [Acytostelium subglobosum LB1]|eukprot:XP_012758388.1 hypothetical protein SAMD00019534_009670 [Acytostelium subglobosum LB1]
MSKNKYHHLLTYWLRIHMANHEAIFNTLKLIKYRQPSIDNFAKSLADYNPLLDEYSQPVTFNSIGLLCRHVNDLALFQRVYTAFEPMFQLTKSCNRDTQVSLVDEACFSGSIDIAKFLVSKGFHMESAYHALGAAVDKGNLELVKYILEISPVQSDYTMTRTAICNAFNQALLTNNMEIAKYLEPDLQGTKLSMLTLTQLLDKNLDAMVDYVFRCKMVQTPNSPVNVYQYPIKRNNFEQLNQFIEYFNFPVELYDMTVAVGVKGGIEMVKFVYRMLRPLGHTPINGVLTHAASGGDMDILRYLVEELKVAVDKEALDSAAKTGNIQVFSYLLENSSNQCRCSPNVFDQLAANGDLEIIRLLHTQRSGVQTCSANALTEAASKGHLEVVKFLSMNRTEGMELHTAAWCVAAGRIQVLEFLLAHNRADINFKSVEVVNNACRNGNVPLIQMLLKEGFAVDTTAMDIAAAHNRLNVVQYLHANRTEGCTTAAIDTASSNGHLEVVRFLNTYRKEGCTFSAMDGAAKNGHLDVVEYLHESRTEGASCIGLDRACVNNHLDVVKFFLEKREERWSDSGMEATALKGNTKMLRMMRLHINPTMFIDRSSLTSRYQTPQTLRSILCLHQLGLIKLSDYVKAFTPTIDSKYLLLQLQSPKKMDMDKLLDTVHAFTVYRSDQPKDDKSSKPSFAVSLIDKAQSFFSRSNK